MTHRYIRILTITAFALFLASCGGGGGGDSSRQSITVQTGAVTTHLVWDFRDFRSEQAQSPPKEAMAQIIPSIVFAEITGPGISPPINATFPFAAGEGTLPRVPPGTNRRLLVQGRTDAGVVTHQGVNENFTVEANVVTTVTILLSEAIVQAAAGPDRTAEAGSTIQLDGTASIVPQGDTIFFDWHFVSIPAGSRAGFDNPASPLPRFTPDMAGLYVIELTVSNQVGVTNSDQVRITVPRTNQPPTASISASAANVFVGERVILDGSGSTDPDGDILSYRWFLDHPAGSAGELENTNQSITALIPDIPGEYIVQLVVDDGVATPATRVWRVSSQPAQFTITAVPVPLPPPQINRPPIAAISVSATRVFVPERVTLDGSRSTDPDGDTMTYRWVLTVPRGSASKLENSNQSVTAFHPDSPGDYVVQLIVDDGVTAQAAQVWRVSSQPAQVTVTAIARPPVNERPVADAGQGGTVQVGTAVTLDGSRSFDPNPGDTLFYQWVVRLAPPVAVDIANPAARITTVTLTAPGTYIFGLVVSDGELVSAPATVVFQAIEAAVPLPPQGIPGIP